MKYNYGQCEISKCNKPKQHKSGKYCAMHLARLRRNGTPQTQNEMGVLYNLKLGKLSIEQIQYIRLHSQDLTDKQISQQLDVPYYLIRYARRKIAGRKYKGFNKKTYLKLQYREQKNNTCEICGWNEAPCDVHHKTPLSKGGTDSYENYICLCPNHHRVCHYQR